jgi:hypothetical protein
LLVKSAKEDVRKKSSSYILSSVKGRWERKMRGLGKEAINQHLSGIVAIGGYFKFERAVSL